MGDKKKGAAPKPIFSRTERLQLMLESSCDERTIRRWERGKEIKPSTRERLVKAARKLDIPVPVDL